MATLRRKFTEEQKVKILEDATIFGVMGVLKRFDLSYSVYTKWKNKILKDKA